MARRSCVALMSVLAAVVDGSDESVHGVNLGKCNRDLAHDPNWPSTGYMRGDYCTATSSDAGSHYLCVDLPDATTSSGSHYSPFWVETGQSPSGEEAAELPLAGPWCICMWAFRSMYAQHNEFAGMIDCTASNSWVVENYDVHEPALAAVCHRCNVAGLSPDAGLREKCIAAGVPAAKGTGRPEDFARTAADEPGVGPSGGLNSTLESPAAVALTAAVLIVALIAGGSWFKGRRGSPLGAGSTAQPLRVSAPRDDADVANPSADMK